METNKVLKMTVLNLSIAAIIVVLFSKGLVGMELFGGSILETALSFTTIFVALMSFAVGNYSILTKRQVKLAKEYEVRSPEEVIRALKRQNLKRTFANDISLIIKQSQRFSQKEDTIDDILLQKFNSEGMSYAKFKRAINDLENLFYMNIRSILNKLEVFDEADYNRTKRGYNRYKSFPEGNSNKRGKFSNEFITSKMALYNEYITFVNEAVEDNEEMLLKLDKLLLEISKFTSLEEGELEKMSAMIELDDLISKTKLYK